MKKICLQLSLLLALLFASSQVNAFDGDRRGFMLNLGAGLGQAKYSWSNIVGSGSRSAIGYGGDFKIGAGLSSQAMIYYTNRTLFYSINSQLQVNGMSAIGFSYFLKTEAPSFFFSGALGIGVRSRVDSGTSGQSGFGFTLGAGYEFAPNWIVEGTYMRAKVLDNGFGSQVASNLMVSVSWFAY